MDKFEIHSDVDSIFCYKSKKFYVLTLPKIASSWLFELFKHNPQLRDIPTDKIHLNDANQISINQLTLTTNSFDINCISYDIIDFCKDWEKLLKGISFDMEFVFLMRNPIDKFIVGFMQDELFKNFQIDSPIIIELLEKYKNKNELDIFYKFHKEEFLKYNNSEWWHTPNLELPNDVYNVLSYLIKNILQNWMSDIKNITQYRTGHKNTNLFLYYKLLFNSKIDKTKIKILDIDYENIFKYLNKKYELELDTEYDQKYNPNAPVLKLIAKNYMIEYQNIINAILSNDILLYCDLYNHLYSENITPEILWKKTFFNN